MRHRRREIHQQILALMQEGRAASAVLDKKDAAAIEVGRRICLDLCNQLHCKLPRELRDMIYEWVIDSHKDEVAVMKADLSDYDFNTPSRHDGITYYICESRCGSEQRFFPWWQDAYVGKDVVAEISERWYATRIFDFDIEYPDVLRTFFATKPFGTGIDPAALIQHVKLGIQGYSSRYLDLAESFEEMMQYYLGACRKDVKLTFSIDIEHEGLGALGEALDLLSPAYDKLRAESFDKVVLWNENFNEDWTHLFGAKKDEIRKAATRLRGQGW